MLYVDANHIENKNQSKVARSFIFAIWGCDAGVFLMLFALTRTESWICCIFLTSFMFSAIASSLMYQVDLEVLEGDASLVELSQLTLKDGKEAVIRYEGYVIKALVHTNDSGVVNVSMDITTPSSTPSSTLKN